MAHKGHAANKKETLQIKTNAANKKRTLQIKENTSCARPRPTFEYFPPFSDSVFVDHVVFVMFCSFCGIGDVQESICDKCVVEKDIDEVITHYFHRGYPYDVIVGLLEKREGLQMCVRTLKRRLRSLGLKTKDMAKVMDDSEITTVIREEMRDPGSLSEEKDVPLKGSQFFVVYRRYLL